MVAEGKAPLQGTGDDPEVVLRDGCSLCGQLRTDLAVVSRGFVIHSNDGHSGDERRDLRQVFRGPGGAVRAAVKLAQRNAGKGASQFFATPSPIPAVPQGPLKIAQHFSAGLVMGEAPSPDRDGRPLVPMTRSSLRDLRVEAPRTQHSSAGLFSVVPVGRPISCQVVAKN